MSSPSLLIVDAPTIFTGVTKTIGSPSVLRLTPILITPPVALDVKALNVEVAVIKSIVPVPCAFKDKTPVMF